MNNREPKGLHVSEVKTFKIIGKYRAKKRDFIVAKEVRALSLEEALDKFYSYIGGNQKLKRMQIRIIKIEELKPENIKNPKLKKIALLSNPVIYIEE